MASKPSAPLTGRALAAALAAAGCMGMSSLPVSTPVWVRNALTLGRSNQLHSLPSVARFEMDEGGAFILDRSHQPALVKFDDSPEIWAVEASRGPRGDILFKDDVGDVVLRLTRFGGMTAFTRREPAGAAATFVGATNPLKMSPIGPAALYQRMVIASSRCSRAARHLVSFDAPNVDSRSSALIGDAAWLAMQAIVEMADTPDGRAPVGRIGKVVLTTGSKFGVRFEAPALIVTVAPDQGLAGHPSSARIAEVIDGE